jgi:hypothetical protein
MRKWLRVGIATKEFAEVHVHERGKVPVREDQDCGSYASYAV